MRVADRLRYWLLYSLNKRRNFMNMKWKRQNELGGREVWCLHLCLGLESGHVLCLCLKSNLYSSAVFCWYIIYQGLISQCQAIRNVNVGCSWLVWAVCMEVCIWKSCSLVNVFNLLRCVVPDNFLSSNVVRPLSTLSSFLDGHPSPSWLKAIALPYIYEPVHSSCKAKVFT